ncbi:MAG TPA: DUF4231 domain-containing protein [Thermomicrobiales bacterium]|jgi:hypothetical protein|nr:DUF4231 domain-containing protein [Thermomicrobiales bacterium]
MTDVAPQPLREDSKDVRDFARADYPALYDAAAAASRANQKLHTRSARVELGLLLLTSALIALEGWNWIHDRNYGTAIRIAIAITLATALLLKAAIRNRRFDARWFEARGLAEAVKSQSWQYMMLLPPYDGGDAVSHAELRQQFNDLMRLYPSVDEELHRLPTERGQATEGMRAVRALGLADRRSLYARYRVRDQIDWYRRNALKSKKQSTRWFILGFVVQLVAVVLAILMVGVGGLPILQLTVAISIAVTALNRSGLSEDRSKEYGVAAQELSMLLEAVELTESQEQFASAVRDLETVIGKEHSAWFARR